MFFYGPCYYKLLSNFDFYMDQKLEFIENSKYPEPHRDWVYPIAKLGDIEVHFSHYKNSDQAQKDDKESIEVITNFDFKNVYNINVDSPASIYTLLKYLFFLHIYGSAEAAEKSW